MTAEVARAMMVLIMGLSGHSGDLETKASTTHEPSVSNRLPYKL